MRIITLYLLMVFITSSLYSKDEVKWSPYQGKKTWQEAKEHCQSLKMRVPTIEELKLAEKAGTTKGWRKNGSRYWAANKNLKINNSTFMALASGFSENVETHKIESQLGVFCANVTDDSILLDKIRELEENNGSVKEIEKLKFEILEAKSLIYFSDYQGKMDWDSANKKCKSIKMRLPTIDELKKAYRSDITKSWQKDGRYYCSSTPYDAERFYYLLVDDYGGDTGVGYRIGDYDVRCRR